MKGGDISGRRHFRHQSTCLNCRRRQNRQATKQASKHLPELSPATKQAGDKTGINRRYPLYINSAVRCIKYWLKLTKMVNDRLPKQAYLMLLNLDENGKQCWTTLVKKMLFSYGFGYVWLAQGVGCERSFVSLFKQRMKDMYIQEWNESITSKDVFQTYKLFKTNFVSEQYFEYIDIRCFRDCLIKLRLGVLPINGSFFKRMFKTDGNFLCEKCNVPEDEEHVLKNCTLYNDIRQRYLQFGNIPYTDVLRNGLPWNIRRLSMFLFNAMKIRQSFLEN